MSTGRIKIRTPRRVQPSGAVTDWIGVDVTEVNAAPEEWRAVVGFEGSYEVSSLGRVRSLDRWIGRRFYIGQVLKLKQRPDGYFLASLGRSRIARVHVLVCESFNGARPAGKTLVAHWNGDPTDNRPANLRWATKSENQRDSVRHGTAVMPPLGVGERNGRAKLTQDQVDQIRARRSAGATYPELRREFGISTNQSLNSILSGRRWAASMKKSA